MPADTFVTKLNEQIGNEFAAHQQYVAIAVHYDAETLPQLARFFYRQALEERDHAMMMIQYLVDADADVVVPGVSAPQHAFGDIVAPVTLALEQEKRVTDQIVALVALAREEGNLVGEQFLHWFLQEQREEVSSMSHLLATVERAGDNLLLVEDHLDAVVAAGSPAEAVGGSRHSPPPTHCASGCGACG
jgi:ferritin